MDGRVVTGGISVVCWVIFYLMFRKDRSRYRNCYFLAVALLSFFPFLLFLFEPHAAEAAVAVIYSVVLILHIVPFFLIYNGIVMIRKEGRHLSQLLSLFLGLLILAGEAFLIFLLIRIIRTNDYHPRFIPHTFPAVAGSIFCVSVIYISVSFVIFMIYTLFLHIIPRKKDFDFVIIHGSGLLDGDRVPKLLKDRLDKAIEVYRHDPTPPTLIPSGGKGPDETVSEAEAMTQYLIGHGIPARDILPEKESTTTLENLQFSKRIIDEFGGRKYTALISSNYHVYRALRYCREIGLKCTGIGSHVAFYYWPSAMIREYIAIHAEKKHAVILAAGWIFCIGVLLYLIYCT